MASRRPGSGKRGRSPRTSGAGPSSLAGALVVTGAACTTSESFPAHGAAHDDIVKLFKHFDLDGNGTIDRSEITQVLQKLDAAYWNMKRIRTLFRAADLDRDQVISYREFLKWVFLDGAEQQAMRNALPVLDAREAHKADLQETLENVETAAALAKALEAAEPFFKAEELQRHVERLEQMRLADLQETLENVETVAAFAKALEAAEPLFKAEDLQKHVERLEQMRLPFSISVSTLAGLSCTVNVTREQTVKSLCQEVAEKIDKKAYRIMLAHAGGNLQPATATLEECGVCSSEVQLAAHFGEVDPLLELSLAEFLDSVVHHKVATESEVSALRQACLDGKMSEDDCRDKFSNKLNAALEKEEKEQQAIAEKRRLEEEMRKRKAEEEERRRKAEEQRRAAICAKHCLPYESLAFDKIIARAADVGIKKEAEAFAEDRLADLVQGLAILDAIKAGQEESLALREALSSLEAVAQAFVSEAQQIKADAEPVIEECLPALHSAHEALNRLHLKDVHEVRNFIRPPGMLLRTLEAVCKLRGIKPERIKTEYGGLAEDYWNPSRRLLASGNFLRDLHDFDKDNVPPAYIARLADYIEDESNSPENNRKCSLLGEALCMWVRAIYKYHFKCIELDPLRQKLRGVEEQLSAVMAQMQEPKQKLQQQVEDEDYFKKKLDALGLVQL